MSLLFPFVRGTLRDQRVADPSRAAEDLCANNFVGLTKNPNILTLVVKRVQKYISAHAGGYTMTAKELTKACDVAASRMKVPVRALQAYEAILARGPTMQIMYGETITQDPVLITDPECIDLNGAVHNLVAVEDRRCAMCDKTFDSLRLCDKCHTALESVQACCVVKNLFSSELSALRWLKDRCGNDINVFRVKILRKKPRVAAPVRPKVRAQPSRDWMLEHFNAKRTRAQARLDQFIAEKQSYATRPDTFENFEAEFIAAAKDMEEYIQDKIKKEIRPQGFDIANIWQGIADMVRQMMEKQYLQTAILAIVGAALTALVIWICVSGVDIPILLKILIALVSATVAVGVFGLMLKKVLDIIEKVRIGREDAKAREEDEIRRTLLSEIDEETKKEIKTYNEEEDTIDRNSRYLCTLYDEAIVKFGVTPALDKYMSAAVMAATGIYNRTHEEKRVFAQPESWPFVFADGNRKTVWLLLTRKDGKCAVRTVHVIPAEKEETQLKSIPEVKEEVQPKLNPDAKKFVAPQIIVEDDDLLAAATTPGVLEKVDPDRYINHIDPVGQLQTYRDRSKPQVRAEFNVDERLVEVHSTTGRSYRDKEFSYVLTVAGKSYVSPWNKKKIEAQKESARMALRDMDWEDPDRPMFKNHRISVDPQNGVNSVGLVVEEMLKGTTSLMAEQTMSNAAKSTLSYIHSAATAMRDVKVVAEVVQPFVECAVGAYYEVITGETWIPWSERGFHEKITPVLEKHMEFACDETRPAKLHGNQIYQNQVKRHHEVLTELERELNAMRIPPRYLTNVISARNECREWIDQITTSRITGKDRRVPVGVLFFGPPGTGKSTAVNELIRDVWATLHRLRPNELPEDYSDNQVYRKKLQEDGRDDSYMMHPITEFDEVLQADDVDLRRRDVMWLINAINRAPFKLNMADLEGKKGTYFMSDLVICTRNGRAKVANLGVEDPGALSRRLPLQYSPGDQLGTWNRHGIDGNIVETGLTRADIARQVSALLVQFHNDAAIETQPVPIALSLEQLAEEGKKLKQAHDAKVKQLRSGGKAVNPQGNTLGVDENVMETELLDLASVVDHLDKAEAVSPDRLERAKKLLEKHHRKISENTSETLSELTDLLEERRHSFLSRLSEAKQWTIAKIDRFTEWARKEHNSLIWKIKINVFKNTIKHAWSVFVEWLSTTTGKVCMAMAVCAVVAAIVAGAVALLTQARDTGAIQPQSRTEKERKADEARAKAEKTNVQIVNGQMTSAGAPMGHKGPRDLREQVRIIDMPKFNAISNNLWAVTSPAQPGTLSTGNILMLAGRLGVTVRHVAEAWTDTINIKQTVVNSEGKATSIHRQWPKPQIVDMVGRELCFVRFNKNMPPAADITHLIWTDAQASQYLSAGIERPSMVFRLPNGERMIINTEPGTRAELYPNYEVTGFKQVQNEVFLRYPAETPDGSSGGVTMTTSDYANFMVIGVHGGNGYHYAFDMLMTRELVKSILTKEDGSAVIVPQLNIIADDSVVSPKQQSVTLGRITPGHRTGGKNRICPSAIAPYLMNHPDEAKRLYPTSLPTVMYATTPGQIYEKWKAKGMYHGPPPENPDEVVDPMKKAYTKPIPFHYIDPVTLDHIYSSKLVPQFPNERYYIISFEEAVFGNLELGIKPIDLTTSIGYNFTGENLSREAMLGLTETKRTSTFDEWHPSLREMIRAICVALNDGDFPLGLVVDSLKAEGRGISRVMRAETRLFYATSLAWLIVSKVFRGYQSAIEKNDPTNSIPAVGLVATSNEWTELVKRLQRLPNLILVDAVNFDQHSQYIIYSKIGEWHGNHIAESIVQIRCQDVWKKLTGTEMQKAQLRHIYEAIYCASCDAVHVSGDVAYRDSQTANSGNDRTSQDNSYRGVIEDRLAFLELYKTCDGPRVFEGDASLNFGALCDKHMESGKYGDDTLTTVSETAGRIMTTASYAKALKKTTGGEATMPDKTAIPDDYTFTLWSNADFLKRGFRVHNGRWYAPLQKKIIEDSLFWASRAARRAEISTDTVRSALLEAALHGREYYNDLYEKCERACRLAKVKFEVLSYEAVMALHTH